MTIFAEIQELEVQGNEAVLCTVVRTQGSTPRGAGTKMLVYPDGRISGTVGGGEMESRVVQAALEALAEGQPRLLEYSLSDPKNGDPGVCGGQMEVFVEPIKPQSTVVVVGMGHVGLAVADLAHWLGFRVVVSDDRAELCSPEMVPNADVFHPAALAELPEQVKVNAQTYVILTTRNVKVDVEGLPAILATPASYIGVIGSRRRWETTRKKLLKAGVPEAQIERVVSPIGLELNAETPEEIALSILAEIIMLRRGGDGARMGI
ncbi:MAG: XdhC family protein [Anaerolineales bacterium]|nr:XdhC family protein [Anaerolineales bacterium]